MVNPGRMITDSMDASLSELWELVTGGLQEAWCAAIHAVAKSQT